MSKSNYILKDENAVYYECGFSCDNEIFLKLGSEAFFITDARYTTEAKEFVKNATVIEANRDLIAKAKNLIKRAKIKTLIFDPNEWSINEYEKLSRSLELKWVKKPKFSQKKRIIKRDDEIEIIKKAVKIGAEGFDKFASYLRDQEDTNHTEKRLFFELKNILEDYGEYSLSFLPIVAINQNSAKPHALPSSTKLNNSDLLLVDAGVKYQRYCSDRTRTALFDKKITFAKEQRFKDPKRQKIYDLVLKAQESAIKAVRAGVKASDIDKIAREVIDKGGYGNYFTHSTGHGVGLDIHEEPFISKRSKTTLQEGMVFTVEPGIYLPNEFGVRIEDMVVVTSNGVEIL